MLMQILALCLACWTYSAVPVHTLWTLANVYTKDHIEKIDFQVLIFAVVNWPNSELYGAFVCITCYIG